MRVCRGGLNVGLCWGLAAGQAGQTGPSFVLEPPARVEFSNSSGAWLDCTASGSPPPSVWWVSGDGARVGDVGGAGPALPLRRAEPNGTLALLPFPAAAYRQDVHSAAYRCVAANAVGVIASREVLVRAVVTQAYTVDASSVEVTPGCTAVLRCSPPSFVRDLVRVVSWLREPSENIFPSPGGDGKHWMTPSGELLVYRVEYSDQLARYWCRTRHRLTNQMVTSSPTTIRVKDRADPVPPAFLVTSASVHAAQGDKARLVCLAFGCPEVGYGWHKENGRIGPSANILGPVLEVDAASAEDAGTYSCTAHNAAGQVRAEVRLTVSAPLEVEVEPKLLVVQLGGSAEFRCRVSPAGGLVTWFKDGAPVLGGPGGALSPAGLGVLGSAGTSSSGSAGVQGGRGGAVLSLGAVSREDRGMYQCVVRRAEGDSAQAAAELRLGDAPPVLLYSFIEQTLQPGPSVSLKCSAAGQPTPSISWSLDGFPLPSDHRFLIGQFVSARGDVTSHVNISQVSVEDGGEYRCVAENRAGRAHHAARLNVYGLPYIRQIPKVTAVAGETMEIKCPVAGFPIEEIKWERGNVELPAAGEVRQKVSADGVLRVERVQKAADAGLYSCTARNRAGHVARRGADVQVIAPPKLSPFGPPLSLHVGDRASITCSVVSGDTPLQLVWRKDGQPVDTRTGRAGRGGPRAATNRVDQYNSILLIESLSPEHNGSYACSASNQAAEVTQAQDLVVNVPPVIEPFKFQEGLAEGMRTRAMCGVSRGDAPLRIHWLKDGEPLASLADPPGVSQLDQYTSLLNIPHLSANHSGRFTCVASNEAREVRYSAELSVKVPPSWATEPQDSSVERGRHAFLHCRAKGVPTPTTVWKKAIGVRTGDYQKVLERPPAVRLLANGTLALRAVGEDAEGFYLCQAQNDVGSPLNKVVQLRVDSRPYFAGPPPTVMAKKGETAVLRCDVQGDRPITVVWLRHGAELGPNTDYRTAVHAEPGPEGVVAELHIAAIESADTGAYHCQAKNQFGSDKQLVQLQVQEPPARPLGLQTAQVTSQSVNLQWQHPGPAPGSESLRFSVEYRPEQPAPQHGGALAAGQQSNKAAAKQDSAVGGDGGKPQWRVLEAQGAHSALVAGLRPATRYLFRVVAESEAGRSEPSAELAVRTEAKEPAGPPLRVAARAVSATAVHVTWMPPAAELRHGVVTAYNVGIREDSASGAQAPYHTVMVNAVLPESDDDEDIDGEVTLTELNKFTRYHVVVQAVNEVGSGPASAAVSVLTQEDVPSAAPQDVRCSALSSQSLQVSWQPPPRGHVNGILRGYTVRYEPVPPPPPDAHDDEATDLAQTSAMLTVLVDLRKATNYSVTVLASSRAGDGVPSRPIFCHTSEDAPGPPASVKVVSSGPRSLLVTWLPPNEPNGALTAYNVYSRVEGGGGAANAGLDKRSLPAAQTSLELAGLDRREYQFWVTASTRVGEGQSSPVVAHVPTEKVPARVASLGTVVRRPWRSAVALACRAVGKPAPRVAWRPATRGQLLDTGELVMAGLSREHAGNYTCTAHNEFGSDSITYALVVQVPPAAPQLLVGTPTRASVLVHWKSVGPDVTGYSLHYRRQHGDPSRVDLPRRAQLYDLKGLQCGSQYVLHLVAHSAVGSSPGSAPLSVRTLGQPPGRPAAADLLRPGPEAVRIRLAAWPDGGCPLLYFVVRYRPRAAQDWTLVSNSLKPQRRFSIRGLSPASGYQLQVEAHNSAGSSTEEFSFYTLTEDGVTPVNEVLYGSLDYLDMRLALPLGGATFALAALCVIGVVCCRTKQGADKPGKDGEHTAVDGKGAAAAEAAARRERYYATLRKMAMQPGEKIPETSEDISPYATFQLSDSAAAQNTLLHSFAYHEHAMTEAASPPPLKGRPPRSRRGSHKSSRSPGRDSDESDSEGDGGLTSSRTESSNQLDAGLAGLHGPMGPMGGMGRLGVPGQGVVAGPGAMGPAMAAARGLRHSQYNFMYHGAHSSTSSDISPMSEQKSLPRRGRLSRWQPAAKGTPAEDGPACATLLACEATSAAASAARCRMAGRPPEPLPLGVGPAPVVLGGSEASEAECDMDTLKRLKLGLRSGLGSSLWSRTPRTRTPRPTTPGPPCQPPDYSIAV